MPTLLTHKSEPITIDMVRDDCKLVERREGNPADFKKAWSKMKRILKTMPPSNVDTVADVKKTRDSRGRL